MCVCGVCVCVCGCQRKKCTHNLDTTPITAKLQYVHAPTYSEVDSGTNSAQ